MKADRNTLTGRMIYGIATEANILFDASIAVKLLALVFIGVTFALLTVRYTGLTLRFIYREIRRAL